MFGMNVLALRGIDHTVLDFPISIALWNAGAQTVDSGSANWRRLGFIALKIFRVTNEHPIGHNQFQIIGYRVVWQSLAKIDSGTLKNLWTKKTITVGRCT